MDILEGLIEGKTLKVLKVFLERPSELFHINKVASESKVPVATTFRIMNSLFDIGIIEKIGISRFKVYRLADNKKTKKLRGLL